METAMSSARLEKLFTEMDKAGMDGLALNPGPSLTYMTGLKFHLMERPVVMLFAPGNSPAIVLPELESAKLSTLSYPVQPFPYGENPDEWDASFAKAVKALGLNGKKIGVEPGCIRLLEFGHISKGAPDADFPDAGKVVGSLRLHKDVAEAAAMRRAVGVAQRALEVVIPQIRIGMTEREVAAELVVQLLRHGSEPEMSFSPIVSSGPNSANPHASPSERKLQHGDLLVVDWGAIVDGYLSDLTRTFAVGDVDPEYSKIHQVVLEANQAGRAAARPGHACENVDQAARKVIEKAGYGRYFFHRTGHGIGMESHEEPNIRSGNIQLMEPGMAFTVEPGIYLTDRNGVRIEDNMVITENGAECLSDMQRELRVIG